MGASKCELGVLEKHRMEAASTNKSIRLEEGPMQTKWTEKSLRIFFFHTKNSGGGGEIVFFLDLEAEMLGFFFGANKSIVQWKRQGTNLGDLFISALNPSENIHWALPLRLLIFLQFWGMNIAPQVFQSGPESEESEVFWSRLLRRNHKGMTGGFGRRLGKIQAGKHPQKHPKCLKPTTKKKKTFWGVITTGFLVGSQNLGCETPHPTIGIFGDWNTWIPSS